MPPRITPWFLWSVVGGDALTAPPFAGAVIVCRTGRCGHRPLRKGSVNLRRDGRLCPPNGCRRNSVGEGFYPSLSAYAGIFGVRRAGQSPAPTHGNKSDGAFLTGRTESSAPTTVYRPLYVHRTGRRGHRPLRINHRKMSPHTTTSAVFARRRFSRSPGFTCT